MDPAEMRATLQPLFDGCMKGRTMYVVPFSMGPLGSHIAHIGVELTDSAYVAVNQRLMTRMGKAVYDVLGVMASSCPACTPWARPLAAGEKDTTSWPCNPKVTSTSCTTPKRARSGPMARATAATPCWAKCLALRIASTMAATKGWLAEHMLILGVTNPEGKKYHVAAAFPAPAARPTSHAGAARGRFLCGLEGHDHRRRHRLDQAPCRRQDVRHQPRGGLLWRGPGTNMHTNPNAHAQPGQGRDLHQRRPDRRRRRVVGRHGKKDTGKLPDHLIDWQGQGLDPQIAKETGAKGCAPQLALHRGRHQQPGARPQWDDANGVAIDAFIFGGRRSTTVPLVTEARTWTKAFMAATMGSETTAAAFGAQGVVRRDPFAMLPFCGYNMSDYFQHWLNMEGKDPPPASRCPCSA